METNLEYGHSASTPTQILISRIFKVLDDSVDPETLEQSLQSIDTKIWLHETARSGSHGHAARAYSPKDKSHLPLDWLRVRDISDKAVEAIEARVNALDQAEAEESSQSRGYGTIE